MSPPRSDDPNGERTAIGALTPPPPDMDAALALFARATSYLPRTPRLGAAAGYRVFWLAQGELRWRDVVADGRCHVVVGRHASAHLRLDGDPEIALRHLVFRASTGADGAVELQALDLGASFSLLIDGSDEASPSAALRGPLIATLGTHALCGLPYDGCQETGAVGGHGDVDREDAVDPVERLESPRLVRPPFAHALRSSSEEPLHTVTRSINRSTHIEALVPAGERPWLELRLVGEHGKLRVLLTREQLDGMVLVGRYERCVSRARAVFSDAVSRVHLGLIRSGDAVEVLDLGSTNGIAWEGRHVQRVLVEEEALVHLAGGEESVEILLS